MGHTGQAWQGAEDGHKCGNKDSGRVPRGESLPRERSECFGYDLRATLEARVQHRLRGCNVLASGGRLVAGSRG